MKKSILDLLSPIVTFTCSSRNTKADGGGSVSRTTFISPIGPSVYVIFFCIYFLSFSPVSRAEDANHILSICESYCYNIVPYSSKAEKPYFVLTVRNIFSNYSIRIRKSILGELKCHPMLLLILKIFLCVPLKTWLVHSNTLLHKAHYSNINIWVYILLCRRGFKRHSLPHTLHLACWTIRALGLHTARVRLAPLFHVVCRSPFRHSISCEVLEDLSAPRPLHLQ